MICSDPGQRYGAVPRARGGASSEGGFALALVVLLLFAIAVAGAAGYQAVRTEFFQSQQSSETGLALAVAEAGLQWYIGGQRGQVADTTQYDLNGGTAVITTRKVAELSDEEDLYLVTSEGTYTDPRYPQVPAVRVVSQYTIYKKIPMNTLAPLITSSARVRVQDDGYVDGRDLASAGQCPGAPTADIAGVVARAQVQERSGGTIHGSPEGLTISPFETLTDSVGLAWEIYSDPNFPVDYDGSWPNFWSLPADSFPVVRWNGNFSPNWFRNGRGVLIIDGELQIPNWSFWTWYGIVIADDIQDVGRWGYFWLYGALVGGQGSQMGNLDMQRGDVRYHSCYVAWAGASLAHMEPVSNSWWEESG